MSKKIKKIWNTITSILVAVVVLLAIALWGVQLLGVDVFVVQSGSMEPEIRTGSVVYVTAVEEDDLEVGDVITFQLTETVKGTHQIIEILGKEEGTGKLMFRTKGTANEHADEGYVTIDEVVGKVRFSLPYVGYAIAYIQQPPGSYVLFAGVALILLLVILPDLIFSEKKKPETEEHHHEA